uniref:DNA polymerase n=1 Tax=viral metagenome TaxID=1070528 RepID=A0A6C0IX15_9ZZZZ
MSDQNSRLGTSPLVPLEIQAYDWVSSDRDGVHSVRIWGHTKDGPNILNEGKPDEVRATLLAEQVLVRIEDYEPFCRLELPTVVEGRPVRWNLAALKVYVQWLKAALGDHAPTRINFKEMEKLYYFKNHAKFPFLICYFRTEEAMRHCVNLIGKQGYEIEQLGFIKSRIWETSITTIHRLITDAQIGYGQWFRVQAERVPEIEKISSCEHEFIASWKNMQALTEEETKSWVSSPLIAAIDIETYSHNHRAMPNRDYVSDIVFQCSFILQRLNKPETREKILLVVGPCDDIEGATVLRFDHEIKLIDGLADLITMKNPSVLLGYNIFAYDFPYMDARLKLYLRDWRNCGLIRDQATFVNSRVWKSSAYGFMTIAPLDAEGRICIDMYPIIKRDHKLDRYTLDFVSKHFLGRGKHDVSARQMFETYAECRAAEEQEMKLRIAKEECEKTKMTEGLDDLVASHQKAVERLKKASAAMATVGRYCLEDSCLCIDLLEKLNTWIMLTELATIVCVKMTHIFTQGQQLRVQNQIYQYAYREDFVIDERPGSKDGFKGGHVQDPIPGLYRNILIFDFASLYPSIIRAFNICYTTLVPPESNIPDEMCNVLAWTELDENKKSPTFGQTLHFRYRFVKKEVFHGILPRMCDHLVAARSATRKLIKPDNDPVYNNVLNQRQLGLKVTANSIFGALGVQEGRLPLPEAARSITAMGRVLIGMAADHVRERHQGRIIYGDSVTGDTPILIQRNGLTEWVCIRDLCEHPKLGNVKGEMDMEPFDIKVWSDQGWTKIKRFIWHKTQKQLYRVLTHTGCVDVTEDHSLLLPNGQEIQPHQVGVGTPLLHKDLPPLPTNGTLTPEEAWVWGFFYGDGSCGNKSSWALNSTDLTYLNYALQMLAKCEPRYNFKIYDTMESSHVYKLEPTTEENGYGAIIELVDKYRTLFYNEDKHKVVPQEVLSASKEAKIAFMNGYYCADGAKTEATLRMDNKGKIGTASLYHLLVDLGYNTSINIRADKDQIYRLNASVRTQRKDSDVIKKIIKLPPTNDYVYDLETENHHFSAGIGRMVVHNTDSIMVDMGITDPNECLRIGAMLSEEITKIYPRPLSLEFERGMAIALFIKKKKYAGVPLAIIKLIDGDIIEKVPFDRDFDDPTLDLYRFTILRDGKRKVLHVAVPNSVLLADVPIELNSRVVISWPETYNETTKRMELVGRPTYKITRPSGELVEVQGRKAIAGIPLAAGGKPDEKELMKKGIILARRDNCIWAREAYQRVLLSIMFGKPLEYTLNIIDEEVIKMMTRQIPFTKMVVTRAIGSNYKPNSTHPLKIFSDELRRQGHVIQAGDRIDYVFVRNQDPDRNEKQGLRMRIPEMYWANSDAEPLDRVYYVEKSIMNPINQILYLGYKAQIDAIEAKCKPATKKRKKIYTYVSSTYMNTWVKMIKAKEDLVNTIKYVKPHFTTQDPAFTCNLFDRPPPLQVDIVG